MAAGLTGAAARDRSFRRRGRPGTAMRLRPFSPRTEKAYLGWMRRFHAFHGRRDQARLGAADVTAFLNTLAEDRRVAASTQGQALAALLFLYRHVLGLDLPWLDELVRARRPARLPAVLSRDEVRAVLERMDGVPRLMATLLYGSVLRLLECCRLRAKDLDLERIVVVVRQGEGANYRRTGCSDHDDDIARSSPGIDRAGEHGTWRVAATWKLRAARWMLRFGESMCDVIHSELTAIGVDGQGW